MTMAHLPVSSCVHIFTLNFCLDNDNDLVDVYWEPWSIIEAPIVTSYLT